jgi:HEPN domain-containing protein
VDVDQHIAYWRSGGEEDLAAAESLLQQGHARHALFFAHLAVEKLLKAHVCRATRDVAPRTHDLLRLAEIATLPMEARERGFFARFQRYCFLGRYPDRQTTDAPTEAASAVAEAREVIAWLTSLLP